MIGCDPTTGSYAQSTQNAAELDSLHWSFVQSGEVKDAQAFIEAYDRSKPTSDKLYTYYISCLLVDGQGARALHAVDSVLNEEPAASDIRELKLSVLEALNSVVGRTELVREVDSLYMARLAPALSTREPFSVEINNYLAFRTKYIGMESSRAFYDEQRMRIDPDQRPLFEVLFDTTLER